MIKKINTAEPFFFKKDIDYILKKFKNILMGNGKLSMGKYTRLFEKSFANYNKSKYCLVTSSGTSSLEIILKAMNIKNNDEVIVPSHTFIATASAVMNVGAKPIFCDIDENFLLDFSKLDRLINKKTKAVIIVHFGGLIHDEIFKIKKYLSKKNIYFIEDSSHAHGAKIDNIKAGNLSDASAFSLYSSKIMTTGEGGLITTNNKKIYLKCASIRSRGLDIRNNKEIYSELGSNYRFTEIQALLGLAQLKNLDKFINHRLRIASIYKKLFLPATKEKKIRIIKESKNILNPRWKYTVFLLNKQSREKIQKNMKTKLISVDWAYDPLVHLQPVMQKYFSNKKGMLSFSERLAKTHINLPIHYGISPKQAEFIAKTFLKNI